MIYILIIYILSIVGIFFYLKSLTNDYGIVLLIENSQYELVAIGWDAFFPIVSTSLFLGAFSIGLLWATFSDNFNKFVCDRKEKMLLEEKENLARAYHDIKERAEKIENEIQRNVSEKIANYEKNIAIYEEAYKKSKSEIEYLKKNSDKMLGRLKGAQQKAARIKKSTTDERSRRETQCGSCAES